MTSLSVEKLKKFTMLVLAVFAVFAAVVFAFAVFTDHVNRTTTLHTATFDDEGYTVDVSAPNGYFTASDTVDVILEESNAKSKDIFSQITITATWESLVPGTYPWDDISISVDGNAVSHSVSEDQTLSFTLPEKALSSGGNGKQSNLTVQLPADLAATGTIKFSFEQIELSSGEWTHEYDKDNLSTLNFEIDAAWNISKDQATALGNTNRDIVALLASGTAADDYSLEIIKNGSDINTNYGQMMNWTAKDQTPWADYNITDLTISEGVTTIGCYAFAGETGITTLSLPNTVNTIGMSAFQGSGLTGTLAIPATVQIIDSLAFGDLPEVNIITFAHGSDDSLILPDNTSEGEETSGAFYVPDFVKTTFEFNGNTTAEDYNWVADNRLKVGISEILLSYSSLQKGGTAEPILVFAPGNYDAYQSIQYEITSGDDYATIDADTGVLTGTAVGTVTVQVTIIDANGDTVRATCDVNVQAVAVTSATLSYEDVAVGDTVNPNLTINPENADIVSKTYEITSGSSYATINTSTGALTATGNGVVVVKVTIIDETGKETVSSCTVTCGTLAEGTRYVWEKFNRSTVYEINVNDQFSLDIFDIHAIYSSYSSSSTRFKISTYPTIYYAIYETGTFNTSTGKWSLSDYIDGGSIDSSTEFILGKGYYLVFNTEEFGNTANVRRVYCNEWAGVDVYIWTFDPEDDSYFNEYTYWSMSGDPTLESHSSATGTYSQGSTSYGKISSAAIDTYPADSYSGSYWYVYQGTDCIDADAVTYSASSVTAGEEITVNVTPSTKNVYGGTISYQYEYSTDGGVAWTTAGTSTETSYTITVPEDADSFVARVRANDNWGFTSSVYIYADSVTVVPPVITISNTPSQDGTLTYTGSAQAPAWSDYDSTQLTIGGMAEATNAGTYGATFTPKSGYAWNDGTTTAKTVNWEIEKAAGNLSLSTTSVSVVKGETQTISVTRAGNGTVSASSSDTSVATVNVSGTTVIVKGVASGSATITVSVAEGTNHTAPSDAEVSATVTASVSSATLSYANVAVGSTVSPTLTIDPSDADITSKTYEITTGSSYATIDTSTGTLTATGNGVVVVKVTIEDETGKETVSSCTVTCGTPAVGTRYVWMKYNNDITYVETDWQTSNGIGGSVDCAPLVEPGETFSAGGSYSLSNGYFKLGDIATFKISSSINDTTDDYVNYYNATRTSGDSYSPYYIAVNAVTGKPVSVGSSSATRLWRYPSIAYVTKYESDTKTGKGFLSSDQYFAYNKYKDITTEYSQGTFITYASSVASTTYPTNSYSGSYWYVYKNEDSIDPDAVTYSASSVTAGEKITVNVTPSTKNVCGGTISYQYEYSTDGGSTWNTAGTTTANSYTVTVPEDAETFIARVIANDSWGFTSSVYIYGSSITVSPAS